MLDIYFLDSYSVAMNSPELDAVIQHFTSPTALAKELNISRQAVNLWQKKGYIPTAKCKLISKITNGKFSTDYLCKGYERYTANRI